jgi:hypothetical protein
LGCKSYASLVRIRLFGHSDRKLVICLAIYAG